MPKVYLVTGMAGTGKTTLERIFAKKGYETSDIDDGFAGWYDRKTMRPAEYKPDGGKEWLAAHTYRLHLEVLKQHIQKERSAPLIMFGHAGDIYEQRILFDEVFLLTYPSEDLLRHRLLSRTGNSYGKHPDELVRELSYYEAFQSQFTQAGAVTIDCSLPVDSITSIIEEKITQ